MKAAFQLDVSDVQLVADAVTPSLRDTDRISFQVRRTDKLDVRVETDSLGILRGVSNTVLMLTKLSDRILQDNRYQVNDR